MPHALELAQQGAGTEEMTRIGRQTKRIIWSKGETANTTRGADKKLRDTFSEKMPKCADRLLSVLQIQFCVDIAGVVANCFFAHPEI